MTKNSKEKIAVIGGGSWGTALADLLARNGNDTTLWVYENEIAAEMATARVNSVYLPGIRLPESLAITSSLPEALQGCTIMLLVTPVQVMRSVLSQASAFIGPETLLVNASKGIELDSLKTVSQICSEILGPDIMRRYVALSGPTFAREVAEQLPTLILAASSDESCARRVQAAVSNPTFRAYTNTDFIGAELGGAVKNVIAIAAGICDGLGFGHNARAALITRGLAEMKRLGSAMGAEAVTFAGLAGMGDLVLTCTGDLSRNRTVGYKLGQGQTLSQILSEMRMVAEGVKSAESVYRLACKLGVDMPIVEQVFRILHEDKPAREAVVELMARDLKPEQH